MSWDIKFYLQFFRSIMIPRLLRVCSWCSNLLLSKAVVNTKSYGGECPLCEFLWVIISNMALYFTIHLSLIWLSSLVTLYIWNLSRVFIILLSSVICKISIISSIGPMECLLSMRCCANMDFPFPYLKSRKFSWNLTLKDLTVCPIYFLLQSWHINW